MSIRFLCACGKKLKASDDMIGRKVLCSECGSPVIVPDHNTATKEVVVPSGAASDTASNLLKQTSAKKKKKKDAAAGLAFRDDKPPPTYNFAETGRQFAMTVVPAVSVLVILVGSVYWLSSSMMTTGTRRPELGEVTGIVLLGGKPLAGATIRFLPIKGQTPGSYIADSMGRTNKDGHYRLQYLKNVFGAALGKHKVEIRAADNKGIEQIPGKYNQKSTLLETVKEGDNEIDFQLELKK